jgi:hypothetical protein
MLSIASATVSNGSWEQQQAEPLSLPKSDTCQVWMRR